ncbi:glycoside hydrolase family 5 protein [Hygrophoropsis aurantiaca]|uniref:Glycoside hydrolase family 5 protein n=1 Tax=Hygrophoropsis aurantiaca TaxID=72124 RepID=A0ACB8ANZ3_9AGAM|nr:glycoside hydrolase family 5 protein [Hygrophoropsis aurantiaca]
MNLFSWLHCLVFAVAVSATLATPSKTVQKRESTSFVCTDGPDFVVNGSTFKYIGTDLYWLPALNTNEDIWYTLGNISAIGIKVIRVWAFNDVDTIPTNGTWFQLIQNGTTTVNEGPNGLQKLDTVIEMAEQQGLYVILSLTNNWYPLPLLNNIIAPINSSLFTRDITLGTNNSLPRNYLSNDYGGMDLYVRQFGFDTHDQFYTNETILNSFMNYTKQVVQRYVNRTSVFSWELANDPRCNSTLPSSSECTTETITTWHATVAAYVKTIDPNHLVSSGNSGFMCMDCPKLYPLNPAPPPPAPSASPAPGKKRRSAPKPFTKEKLLRDREEARRLNREASKRAGTLIENGIRIRGRWVSTAERRQDSQDVGSAFDGSYGVDSQDILNIPEIGFGTFQFFPDQQSYGPLDQNLSPFDQVVSEGNTWINSQAQSSAAVGKPVTLTGFGLVTQENAPYFIPFNMTTAPYGPAPTQATATANSTYGVTDQQQASAYTTWLNTGIAAGLNGIIQYQWGQSNLTAVTGTMISPDTTGESSGSSSTGETTSPDTTGESPNDGYSTSPATDGQVQQVLGNAVQQIAAAN